MVEELLTGLDSVTKLLAIWYTNAPRLTYLFRAKRTTAPDTFLERQKSRLSSSNVIMYSQMVNTAMYDGIWQLFTHLYTRTRYERTGDRHGNVNLDETRHSSVSTGRR